MAQHSWQKIGFNQARCKNPGCLWYRQVEDFDGHKISVYFTANGTKVYHAPECGTPKPVMDEVYSINDVVKEQLKLDLFRKELVHQLKFERIVLIPLLKRF
jgi:hypothetical protein